MRRHPDARQLCGIARAVLDAEPSIDDAEWKERIKWRLAAQGWASPQPHEIGDALDRVEHALGKPRQPPLPIAPSPPRDETRPLSADDARAALSMLAKRFGPLPTLKPRAMPSGESELMTTRERYRRVVEIEQLRDLLKQRRELAATPKEIASDDTRRPAQRDVQRARQAGAERLDQGLRAEAVGGGGGGGRQEPAGGGDE